jgi:hypothetical protein
MAINDTWVCDDPTCICRAVVKPWWQNITEIPTAGEVMDERASIAFGTSFPITSSLKPTDTMPDAAPKPAARCAHASKRIPSADFKAHDMIPNQSYFSETDAYLEATKAHDATHQAEKIRTLKRTLAAWPTCEFGGALSVSWRVAWPSAPTRAAEWCCSVCDAAPGGKTDK